MKIKETLKNHSIAVRYLAFGVLTTIVGWLSYFSVLLGGKALYGLPAADTSSGKYLIVYTTAQVLQWIVSVCFAFFTNKKWVFTDADNKTSTARQLCVFAGGRIITFLVDYGVTFFGALGLAAVLPTLNSVVVFDRELNINELSAKLAAAVIVVISNYFFSKKLVFKHKQCDRSEKNQPNDIMI